MRLALGIAPIVALLVGAPAPAAAKGSNRVAWIGIARGPLSPQRAATLEALILDEIDGYDSFRVVDAGGNALDDRVLAAEASRVAKLIDEGVDHLLNFRHKKATIKLEQAIEVFETRLTPLRDHELLHEALLAKAEALLQGGKNTAALETLKTLAALSPRRVPSRKTHSQKFVSLYDRALAEVGTTSKVEITAEEPACSILVDGKPLGVAPVELPKVAPGRHYVVARWPFASVLRSVQVAPGRELKVELTREGPAEEARVALLRAIEARQGVDAATPLARRLADLSASDHTLVAGIRADEGRTYLMLARHDDEGRAAAVVRAVIPDAVDSDEVSTAVRRIAVALFVDKLGGELELDPAGEVRPVAGLALGLYGRGFGGAVSVAVEPLPEEPVKVVPAPEPEPRADVLEPSEPDPNKATPAERPVPSGERPVGGALGEVPEVEPEGGGAPVTKQWWFWVGVGVALVGAAVGVGVAASAPDPTSTRLEFRWP